MAQHNNVGKWGEDVAAGFLASKGYAIVDRNCRIGSYEVDIIATKGNVIAFVEVKTRSIGHEDPVDAVDARRMRRLTRAVDSYVRAHDIRFEPQIDVITIVGTNADNCRLVHYEDAFMPPLS